MTKTKKLILTFSIILLGCVAFGQNNKIDSLKRILNNGKADTATCETLHSLALVYFNSSQFDSSLFYITKDKQLSEKINYKKGLAYAWLVSGITLDKKGNYPEALNCFYEALKLFEALKIKKGIAHSYSNIALINTQIGKHEEALKNLFISLKLYIELNDKDDITVTYVNLGNDYSDQKNSVEALKYYLLALKTNKEVGDKSYELSILANIGQEYMNLKSYNEANINLAKALTIAQEINDKENLAIIYGMIGGLYQKQNKSKQAIDYLKKGLAIAKEIGSLNTIKNNSNDLFVSFESENNYKEALIHFKNFIVYRDSIFNKDNTEKIVQTKMQYDFDKKEAAAKAQQEIKDAVAKEEIQKQRILKIAVTSGSALLIAIMLLFFNRRKAKHNLQVNKLENKTLRSQLNPHFIFNALASIQKYMNEHPELAQNYLAKFGKLMREVLENSEKEYISLEDEFEMLKKYMDLETLRVTHGFDYEFIINKNADEETIQVPPLLFQPIVENAIWHGVANGTTKGKITIRVAMENELLKVEVENTSNEKSISTSDEHEKRKSFGLQIVKERLTLLSKEKRRKGNLVLSPIENGMKVAIEIPI